MKLSDLISEGNVIEVAKVTLAKPVNEVRIDNVNGAGNVPDNQNIDYMGIRVMMRPSRFLILSKHLSRADAHSADGLKKHLENGGAIASPFLVINIPREWEDGDLSRPASVVGHEGRNRMYAVGDLNGNEPIEVHLFFGGGLRARHIKPEWISRMIKGMCPERSKMEMPGPWFEVPSKQSQTKEGAMKISEIEPKMEKMAAELEEDDLEEVYPGQSSGRLKNYIKKKYGGEITCKKVSSLLNDPDVNNFYKKRASWYKSLHCKGNKQVR